MPPRRRRALLIAGAILLLAAAAVALTIRWALDPVTLRAAAESRLTAMLGQPVTIGDFSLTLFPAPALAGSDIRVGAERVAAPALELRRIRLLPQLRSLIARPIVIREIRLEGLTVSVLRDRTGRWHMPAGVPAPTADGGRGIVIEQVRVDEGRIRVFDETAAGVLEEAGSLDAVTAEVVADGNGLRFEPLAGRIGGSRLEGRAQLEATRASLDLRLNQISDGDLPILLRLGGTTRPDFLRLLQPASLELRVQVDRGTARLSGTGTVQAPQVAVDPLRLEGLSAPVHVDGSRFTFNPTTFTVSGGTFRGSVIVDRSGSPARWAIDSTVSALDVGDFLSALTGRDQRLDGSAAVQAALRGHVGEPLDRSVAGRLHVRVADGVVREFPLLATINHTLRLAEGDSRDTRFEQLSATLAVARGWASTEDLVMLARDVRLEARGRIGFARRLDLSGQAVLSPDRTARAIRSVHELAALRNDRGELEIPLTITGTADVPAIALDLRAAIGKSLREELHRRLRGIIREGSERIQHLELF
jgi:uncharacterized protein involved in outer membrane biogenesis